MFNGRVYKTSYHVCKRLYVKIQLFVQQTTFDLWQFSFKLLTFPMCNGPYDTEP